MMKPIKVLVAFTASLALVTGRTVKDSKRAGEKEVSCGTHQLDPNTSGYKFKTPLVSIGFNPSGYDCVWRFLGTDGCTPISNCEPFQLGNSDECGKDYLELSDGMGSGNKYCGSNGPVNVSSPSTILIAHLKQAFIGQSRKFQCTVSCATPESQVNSVLPAGEVESADCNCGEPGPVITEDNPKIVNGNEAPKGYWRWQVGMVLRGRKSPFCGGSLINDKFVLTAAHCVVTTGLVSFPGAGEVILNDYNFTDPSETVVIRRNIMAISSHPFYNPNTQDYDVAVLELDKPVRDEILATSGSEPKVTPVCLPVRGTRDNYAGDNATVIGWGATTEGGDQSDVIMEVQVPVITNEECNAQYENKITGRMICAAYPEGGKDSCQGDSGGPFMRLDESTGRWSEIGVVSWGEGCAREGKPGVYARVTEVNDWVRMTARKGTWCKQ